jgi:hypothetical protein
LLQELTPRDRGQKRYLSWGSPPAFCSRSSIPSPDTIVKLQILGSSLRKPPDLVLRSRTCRAIQPPPQEWASSVTVRFIMVWPLIYDWSTKLWLEQPSDFHSQPVNMFSPPMPGENYVWQASLRDCRVRLNIHISNGQDRLFYIFRSKISEGLLSCGLIRCLVWGWQQIIKQCPIVLHQHLAHFAIKLNNISPAEVLPVLKK